MAVSAFIMIDVAGDHTKSAYKTMTRIPLVKKVDAAAGPFALVVQIEADTLESLNELVLSRIRSVDGVVKTGIAIILNL